MVGEKTRRICSLLMFSPMECWWLVFWFPVSVLFSVSYTGFLDRSFFIKVGVVTTQEPSSDTKPTTARNENSHGDTALDKVLLYHKNVYFVNNKISLLLQPSLVCICPYISFLIICFHIFTFMYICYRFCSFFNILFKNIILFLNDVHRTTLIVL